ncbi:hypothetical protein F0236_04950 [Vibrio splendidus]|uniref:Uncharacterized protein n=1 Tax=Vibrio splendidus TaxID=29497 RepID=A0A7Y4D456_VIBSP|nr:hypothetical protein [Vibrio splendidus]NOJ11758.1 hypothetical protein [Vibrio splendidus]TVU65193.1 hypothetical protein FQP88_03770 [Vibrio atlanticus]
MVGNLHLAKQIGTVVYESSPFACWWRILAQRLNLADMLFERLKKTAHNFLLWTEVFLWGGDAL